MKSLIICLGYDLESDGNLSPVLINRLNDVIKLLRNNEHAITLLMGSIAYRDGISDASQALAMKSYLLTHAKEIDSDRIMVEDKSTSSVEQLCIIREMIDSKEIAIADIDKFIIISSKYFEERIKLYTEYIFNDISKFEFIGSALPTNISSSFGSAERQKFLSAKAWLGRHKKGDYKTILSEQLKFQEEVRLGNRSHPRS